MLLFRETVIFFFFLAYYFSFLGVDFFCLGKYFSITHPLGSEVTGKKTFIFYFVAGRLGSPKINHLLLEMYFICGHCLERMKGKSGAFIAVSSILAVKGGDSIQLNTVTAHRSM